MNKIPRKRGKMNVARKIQNGMWKGEQGSDIKGQISAFGWGVNLCHCKEEGFIFIKLYFSYAPSEPEKHIPNGELLIQAEDGKFQNVPSKFRHNEFFNSIDNIVIIKRPICPSGLQQGTTTLGIKYNKSFVRKGDKSGPLRIKIKWIYECDPSGMPKECKVKTPLTIEKDEKE